MQHQYQGIKEGHVYYLVMDLVMGVASRPFTGGTRGRDSTPLPGTKHGKDVKALCGWATDLHDLVLGVGLMFRSGVRCMGVQLNRPL